MSYETAAFGIAIMGLAITLFAAWPFCTVLRHARYLSDVQPAGADPGDRAPKVSVIVPACNEQEAIRRCLESLIRQDYPSLEIITINDRSTDRTGPIMDEVAGTSSRLTVVHVTELPPGWIGKNHANAVGARRAQGQWLLFTDGDVCFAPDCIHRAIAHVEAEGLDHLALFPGLGAAGYWERAACCFFGMMITISLQTWHTRNPLKPRAFCGIGAFNLVRRAAYEAVGTHARLRMEVADDITLGKLLKAGGFVSDVMNGRDHLTVRWQVGLVGIIRGLEKNGFCGADYNLFRMSYATVALAAAAVLPLLGTIAAPGWTRIGYAAWLLSQIVALAFAARAQGYSPSIGLAFPVACATLTIALVRSTILTLWRGGIRWRGTFYPLKDLREGHL